MSLLLTPRRKCILKHLSENGGEANVEELISRILTLENKERNYKTRKSVYVSLMQTHLPRLEREGIVRYDRKMGKIVLIALPEGSDLYAETVGKFDIPWSAYYLSLSILMLILGIFFQSFPLIIASAVFTVSSTINILTQKIKIKNG
jgi:DNA-binding transcriptional ArsR family regulator